MGRSRYQVIAQSPHFITSTIVNWIPLFGDRAIAQIILNSLKFLQDKQRIQLYGYVIMENHLHLIASAEKLSREISCFKSFTARSIIDYLKAHQKTYLLAQLKAAKQIYKTDQQYQVWQEGFHPQFISSTEMLLQKLEYIHNNPVKRGYIDEPAHWRYSSYRNYYGGETLLNIEIIT